MNIGAGLAATEGFFAGQERSEDRAFQAQQRNYEVQRMKAGLDTLPDETASKKSGLQLSAAKNSAGLQLLPGQTANAGLEQINEGAKLSREVANIPALENKRINDNAVADHSQHLQALGVLGQLFHAGDKPRALKYANEVAQTQSAATGTTGKNFVDIVPEGELTPEGDKRVFKLVADDGSSVPIPFAGIQAAMAKVNLGKFKAIKGEDGAVHVMNEGTGDVQTKVKALPGLENGKKSEMQLQYQFLTEHPQGPQLSKDKATEMITKGTHKTPEERFHVYQTELLKASAALGRPVDNAAIQAQARALSGFAPNANPGMPSNSQGTPTINPSKYQSLFTP